MLRILLLLLGCLGLGALLAVPGLSWPLRPEYLGAGLLVATAVAARLYWERRRIRVGDDPGAAEREVWLGLAGTALIVGYVMLVLSLPGSEVHRSTGDTGGRASWTMAGGALLAWWIVRDPKVRRDERDLAMASVGNTACSWALALLVLGFALFLAFAPPPMRARLTHWLIANLLMVLLMLSLLAQKVAMLVAYARDRAPAPD